MTIKQKVILCILDGWGISTDPRYNGISMAHPPVWSHLIKDYPHTQLQASELFVGLPDGQMGNSEVGHMTIGSGRILMQDLPRIDQAIAKNLIPSMPEFQTFLDKAKTSPTKVIHLLGLLSSGGIHSHQNHILYLAHCFANEGFQVKLHAFLDGRDTPPKAALTILKDILPTLPPHVQLASMMGRYYGMDRDKRWDRIELAYRAIVDGDATHSEDFLGTIEDLYEQGITDEFIQPYIHPTYKGMEDGDSLVMANFRADRVRQILSALLQPQFEDFSRDKVVKFQATLGMMDYSEALCPLIPPLFTKQSIANTLGEVIAQHGMKQLRVAETEKYAHVTFFFNGGRELLFPGEDRKLVPSPQVATYDLQPEMSAAELTDYVTQQLSTNKYDLIVLNYANPDMVGHTGVVPAILKAIETIDNCLGKLEKAAKENGYALLITADHGNVEQMVDYVTGQPHTAHTTNPVPFIAVNVDTPKIHHGTLQDIAPTVLKIIGLPQPVEMTGKSLLS